MESHICSNNQKTGTPLPFSKSKFFHSLRRVKTQLTHLYKRCTCATGVATNRLNHTRQNENGSSPAAGEKGILSDLSEQLTKTKNQDRKAEKRNAIFSGVNENDKAVQHTDDKMSFWFHQWETGVNLLLPTPPIPPEDNLGSSRPDGDFSFKVIPPPLEFQDPLRTSSSMLRPTSASSVYHRQHNHRNRHNPFESFHQNHTVQDQLSQLVSSNWSSDSNDINYKLNDFHITTAPVTVAPHRYSQDDQLLHSPSLCYSTYSKFLTTSLPAKFKSMPSRPKPHCRCNNFYRKNDIYSKTKFEYLASSIISDCSSSSPSTPTSPKYSYDINIASGDGNNNNDLVLCDQELYQKMFGCFNFVNESGIVWKDLPKNGSMFVESMFIPSWSEQTLRKAPYFPKAERVVNWSTVNIRNERTGLRRQKLQEILRCNIITRKNVWNLRRQIGWMKRHLLMEKRIPNAEVNGDISNRFKFIHWLNENTNNVNSVGRYFDIEEKRMVAIKIIPDKTPPCICDQLKLKVDALREIRALIRLDHINVVQVLTYFEHGNKLHIVLEACDHSLRCELLCASKGVNPCMAHGVIHQILLGLDHCHNNSYLHRNLCPDNILVTVEGIVKIGDFSKSVYLKGSDRNESYSPGTIAYGAPELLALDADYDQAADIWSVGCILVELLKGKVLWNGRTSEEQLLLIHKTVGPLLSRHTEVAMIKEDEPTVKCLHKYFEKSADEVYSFIEKCLAVDPRKRPSCRELLEHNYLKRRNSERPCQIGVSETALPRFVLWEIRPHTSPLESFTLKDNSSSIDSTNHKTKNDNDSEVTVASPRVESLRTKTAVKKPQASVVFSSELVDDSKLENSVTACRKFLSSQHSHPQDFANVKEQLYGIDYRCLWQCFHDISAPTALSTTLQEYSPILRKGNEARKSQTESRRPLENLINCGDLVGSNFCDNSISSDANCLHGLPTGPRSRIQHIINILPRASWNTVQLFTTHLNQSAKKNPKTFSNHLGALTTTLLDQIADAKSKVAGPAIRILNNICESKGELFEPEAERIMESMLNKLGGPSFIEKEGNEVLKHLTNALKPTKAILSLIKFGANHKTAASRQTTVLLVHEALKKLDLIPAFGLPGEQTASQRRLSNAVFDISTRLLRDSNPQTRLAARDIYQLLMNHPGFWYLYQSTVPEEKRQWVNRLLEEIRRFQIIERKSINWKPQLSSTEVGGGNNKIGSLF